MSLHCPRCGEESLIVTQTVMLVPDAPPSPEGVLWGRPPLFGNAPTFCNRTACNWRGELREARATAPPI